MAVKRASSTKRWQRWRARQSTGEIVVGVPVDYALIELMLDTGKIDERDSEDRKKLAEAIRRLCAEACANALDPTPKP